LTTSTDYDRLQLLITAIAKARELGDALLEAEEAGLEVEVWIESTPVLGGRSVRQVIVQAMPSGPLPN